MELHLEYLFVPVNDYEKKYVLQLNHVFKSRDLIMKNDSKVAKHQECAEILSGEKFLDHGFTRPKVVKLAPFHIRFICYTEGFEGHRN